MELRPSKFEGCMTAEAGPREGLRVLIERGGRLGLGMRLELVFDGMSGENDEGELGICRSGEFDGFVMLCRGWGSEIEITGGT